MRIIIGNEYYSVVEGSSVSITSSATDPVPTCTLNLRDINSTLKPQMMQEILILDDQAVPNPTVNMAPNPTLNPYNAANGWNTPPITGLTYTQIPGGGLELTFANVSVGGSGHTPALYTYIPGGGGVHGTWPGWGQIVPGQAYTFSIDVQGSGSPAGFGLMMFMAYLDASENQLSTAHNTGPIPPSNTLTRYTFSTTAPAGAAVMEVVVSINCPTNTNSGSVSITNVQVEPNWFPTVSYPTPFCGPAQTNCQQLPNGQWIRQSRKFAGFINHVTAQDYHGNVRTLVVDSVGYAWLMGTIYANDTFTNQADSAIISTLLNKYLLSNGVAMLTTTNVITGETVDSLQSNWDDLRTIFDGLAGLSSYYWTIDYYWNMLYAPPDYFAMPIALICDDSSNPDMVTTYPAYNFSAEQDATQPGSSILVLGNGSNVAEVVDPSQIAQIGITSGYFLPTATSWMRKVNDSTLASVTDCTTRGSAELLQYDNTRNIYHLTTNVALTPGYGIPITSATEGLSASVQLIQQTTATWLGTDETLTDVWEYAADLGAVNRTATNMMSRIFRITQSGTSAPAISSTTLETFEGIGIVDTVAIGTLATGYRPTVLGDGPIAYYRLDEGQGTVADDYSGLAQQGTINGGVTLNVAGLLTDPSDTSNTAMSFNGTTGEISLPSSGTWPTGNGAWSLEAWCKPTNSTNTNDAHLITIGNPGTNGAEAVICQTSTGGWGIKTNGGAGHDFNGNGTSTAGTIYYIAGTYDGASHLNLYVGVSGTVTHYGPFNCGTLALTTSAHQRIGSTNVGSGEAFLFPGVIDEAAVYTYALTSTQISNHYTAGT